MLSYNYKIILTCQVVNSNCDHSFLTGHEIGLPCRSVYEVKYLAIQKRKSLDVMYLHCLNYAMLIIFPIAEDKYFRNESTDHGLWRPCDTEMETRFLVSTFSDE